MPIIDSDVYGWIVKHNGKMWCTPNNKFFWSTSAAAKNAFGCHWFPEGYSGTDYYVRQKLKEEEKKKIEVIRVKLVAEIT